MLLARRVVRSERRPGEAWPSSDTSGIIYFMARTLRLPERIEIELRRRAVASGRSQNEVIVDALTTSFGLDQAADPRLDDPAIRPPRTRGLRVTAPVRLPEGVTSLDLLDRGDRL